MKHYSNFTRGGFFEEVSVGEFFTYDPDKYNLQIIETARKEGVIVKQCLPDSPACQKHGKFVMQVVDLCTKEMYTMLSVHDFCRRGGKLIPGNNLYDDKGRDVGTYVKFDGTYHYMLNDGKEFSLPMTIYMVKIPVAPIYTHV